MWSCVTATRVPATTNGAVPNVPADGSPAGGGGSGSESEGQASAVAAVTYRFQVNRKVHLSVLLTRS